MLFFIMLLRYGGGFCFSHSNHSLSTDALCDASAFSVRGKRVAGDREGGLSLGVRRVAKGTPHAFLRAHLIFKTTLAPNEDAAPSE